MNWNEAEVAGVRIKDKMLRGSDVAWEYRAVAHGSDAVYALRSDEVEFSLAEAREELAEMLSR
jgi:hypothetical protein